MTAPQPPTVPGAPADGGTQTGQAPATAPVTPPSTTGQAPAQQATQDVSSLPEWAQKLIKDTRDEAATHRTGKQTATQQAQAAQAERDKILAAMGIKPDGTSDADPAEQVAQFQAVAWENAVQLQVVRGEKDGGYDADALLDSNEFLNSLGTLVDEDPGGEGFRTALRKHVKDFVADRPKFKAQAAGPARSGGDMAPGQPGTPRARPTSLMAAVKAYHDKA